MPRLIDADDLLMDNSWAFYDENGNRNDACIAVENAPTVDAISVVRCRDCIHYKNKNHLISKLVDHPYGFCGTINRYIPEAFYCAYGERREDDI